MPAARHPAAPHAAATPPEVAAANTISRSRSPNRNIAATARRALIGQASDFSPISNLQIESKKSTPRRPRRCRRVASRDALKIAKS
jgi:hypothetical protein